MYQTKCSAHVRPWGLGIIPPPIVPVARLAGGVYAWSRKLPASMMGILMISLEDAEWRLAAGNARTL